MDTYIIMEQKQMEAVADAIRLKTGKSDKIRCDLFAEEVGTIGEVYEDFIRNKILGTISIDKPSASKVFLFPSGITEIKTQFFRGADGFRIEKMPDEITYIADYAFTNDHGWGILGENMKLPSELTHIGAHAFSGQALWYPKPLIIPAKVKTIGDSAFSTTMISAVTFLGTPDTISATAFETGNGGNAVATINVPWAEGTVANAPWGATKAVINYNYES